MSMNIFEYAAKNRLRFNYKGSITVEDLYSLRLTELDSIYKALNKEMKNGEEPSLLNTQNAVATDLSVKIEIVKYIVNEKLEEAEAEKRRAENNTRRNLLLEILAQKQNEELQSKSADELKQMLAELT